MMEQAMAPRSRNVPLKPGKSRAALTITYSNAAGVDTVAESSGVYWIPPVRTAGIARHVKNVSGRKSDVLDG